MSALTIKLAGQINPHNAKGLEKRISRTLASRSHDAVIFDVEKVQDISDTGFEMILQLREKEKNLTIRNAGPELEKQFLQKGLGELIGDNAHPVRNIRRYS